MKVYTYTGCDACRKAIKWLDAQGFDYAPLPIRETPPSLAELRQMLEYYDGEIKRLFNTSGRDYREMDVKSKIGEWSEDALLELLAANGNLIKRPFLLGKQFGRLGFKEAEWAELRPD